MTDPPGPGGGGVPGPGGGSAADSLGELGLVHLRAALDALALGVGVQLLLGAATRAVVGPQAATPSGRDVVGRRTALLLGLPAPGTFLVHGTGRDLLGRVLAPATLLEPALDVLVLAFALVAPLVPRHRSLLSASSPTPYPKARETCGAPPQRSGRGGAAENHRSKASFAFSPASLTFSPAWRSWASRCSRSPSASRSGLSVASPAISLTLPLASSAAFFALSVLPIATSLCCFLPAHRSGDTPVRA